MKRILLFITLLPTLFPGGSSAGNPVLVDTQNWEFRPPAVSYFVEDVRDQVRDMRQQGCRPVGSIVVWTSPGPGHVELYYQNVVCPVEHTN